MQLCDSILCAPWGPQQNWVTHLTGWTQSGQVQWPHTVQGASICGSAFIGSACLVASVMSDSLRPHGPWPARLLCPWDSPGKNTGVGCYFPLHLLVLGNFNNKHPLESGKSGGCCFLVTKPCPTFATPWTVARQAPLPMGSPRKYWSGLPFPLPGDLPDPGMEPKSPALAGGFFTTDPPGKSNRGWRIHTAEQRHGRTAGVSPPPHTHTCSSAGTSRPLCPLPGARGPHGLCVPGDFWWHWRVLRGVAEQEAWGWAAWFHAFSLCPALEPRLPPPQHTRLS